MRVLLFGATGLTGRFVLAELLKAGHEVTAVSRQAASIKTKSAGLKKISGDVLSPDFVRQVVPGHDAVISAISEGPDIKLHTQSRGNGNIIEAMEAASIKRFFCMGAEGILDGPDGKLIRESGQYPSLYLPLSYEHSKVQELLQASSLQWTQVCPPMIRPKPANGHYIVTVDKPAVASGKVSAGNIGAFMVDALLDKKYFQKRVGIADEPAAR